MKIAIIGAGNVGSSAASLLIAKSAKFPSPLQIALIDINAKLAEGKMMDLAQMAVMLESRAKISGGDDYELAKDCDIAVITAGFTRKLDQSRDDLIAINAKIVSEIAAKIAQIAPKAILIVVTNPLDIMVFVAQNASGFEAKRVIGMAAELDLARLKYYLAQHLGGDLASYSAKCLGLHGPGVIYADIAKDGETDCLNRAASSVATAKKEAANGGMAIIERIGTSAYYAPAAGVVQIISAISGDGDGRLCCSVLDGDNIALSRYVRIDENGVSEILDLGQSDALKSSEEKFKKIVKELKV